MEGQAKRVEDGELVERALAGEAGAFTELVDRYRNLVCGAAYHYLGSFEDAQDVAQDAFVHAYLHLKELRDPGKFAPWLRRIAMNLCADLSRRRSSRLSMSAGGADELVDALEKQRMGRPFGVAEDPLERLNTRMVVQAALEQLSEKARLTVILFYLGGYSQAEIAHFLEIPVNTVRSRLQKAKRLLREEMIPMLTEGMDRGKPDPDFARRVVEEAMRRGEEAIRGHAQGEAIRHYDEALTALDDLSPSEEQQRLKMVALWKKGEAERFPLGNEAALTLYEQSLSLAEELGDRKSQAEKLIALGITVKEQKRAEGYYQRALDLYRELDESRGQAECLLWLGSQQFLAKDAAAGMQYYEQALPLLEAAGSLDYATMCRAMLALLAEVGAEQFPTLPAWGGCCQILEKKAGEVRTTGQPGIMWSVGRMAEEGLPAPLRIRSIFSQIAQLGKFLDESVDVGRGWSGEAFSYSYRPLLATVTVISRSERVIVPAGTFEGCLLTEQVTREGGLPDDAAESSLQLNREMSCGTRRAWFAPGVGLVQLQVETAHAPSAMVHLMSFSANGGVDDYLPLAIGNAWNYAPADVPEKYVAREIYRVAAREEGRWYLEQYDYRMPVPDEQPA